MLEDAEMVKQWEERLVETFFFRRSILRSTHLRGSRGDEQPMVPRNQLKHNEMG